eukprot:m.910965 g.910965  ORF g.910965 m.910965 type:complete len:69 (+) comp60113_c0_seq5:3415-3621(+)
MIPSSLKMASYPLASVRGRESSPQTCKNNPLSCASSAFNPIAKKHQRNQGALKFGNASQIQTCDIQSA